MFDRENKANLAALKSEVLVDPATMNYDPKNTKEVLHKLNTPSQNATSATGDHPPDSLTIPEIAGVIDTGEYEVLSAYDKVWVNMFIALPAEQELKPYRAKLFSVFAGGSKTRVAINALRSKRLSRAEELFGVGTEITRTDWLEARAS